MFAVLIDTPIPADKVYRSKKAEKNKESQT
jgi:hypothetical protein